MDKLPIDNDIFESCSLEDEDFKGLLQRFDKKYDRSQIARIFEISRRKLYRLLVEYKISEYAQSDYY